MQETPKPTKKALQQRIKEAQKALKAAEESELYPALRKKCKYCHLVFTTAATRNGQKQEFCKPTHRWAFAREGKKPIDVILKRQEKRLRQIAREEIQSAILERFGGFQRTEFFEIMRQIAQEEIGAAITRMQLDPDFLRLKTEPRPPVRPASPQSV